MTDAKRVAEEIISQAKRAREVARASKAQAEVQTEEVGKEEGKEVVQVNNAKETKEGSTTCVPTFVPAAPVTLRSYGNHEITISQGNDQLWYIQCDNLGPIPVLVLVCEGCGFGYPTGQYYSYGVFKFTTGRTISAAQPRMTGTCDLCGWC